jgi:hypothetical protein
MAKSKPYPKPGKGTKAGKGGHGRPKGGKRGKPC